jgi:signal transduction histidine kinase
VTAEKAIDAFGDCLAALDPETGRVRWTSTAFEAQFPDIKPGGTLAALDQDLDRCVSQALAQSQESGWAYSCLPHRRSGVVYDAFFARGADGSLYLRLQDASERREAQRRHLADRERLILTSRSMSVGEMASTIAHELNQPLGSVANLLNGLSARAARGTLAREDIQPALSKAADQVMFAAGIIARIREYVDSRQPRREPLDLSRLSRTVLDLLDWEIQRERVDTQLRVPEDLPRALGDEIMIQQVMTNLTRNAIDAMRLQPQDRRRLMIEADAAAPDRVEIRISDNGAGLDEDQAARLFTPFFSTKPGGMGIGLNICRSIIELHRGDLWFTRNPEGGATFHIALPARPDQAEAA